GLNTESQLVSLELWILQHHHGVLNRTILAEYGDRCVRRVLGKAVVTRTPFCDHVRRGLMTGGPHRAIGEDDRTRGDAAQYEGISLQRRAAGVEHEEWRNDPRLGRGTGRA